MSAIVAGAWMAASAVLAGVSSNRQKNIKNQHLINANARRDASIEADMLRKQEALSGQAAEIAEVNQRNELRIEQASAVRAADAQVAAAAAGVKGTSVDMTQSAIEFNTGTKRGSLDRELQKQLKRVDQMSRDINITGEASKQVLDIDTSRTGAGLANLIKNLGLAQVGFSV